MPHTYAQNVIHLVFSTKDRAKLIPKELQPRLWAYAAGICKNHEILVHSIRGMEDHIHLLIQIPPFPSWLPRVEARGRIDQSKGVTTILIITLNKVTTN